MIAPTAEHSKTSKRKERAPQISNWLEFIRPHLDPYGRLPRGEQKDYLEKLSAKMKTGVKTLRGFIAAAQYLESNGITSFPEKAKRMPVASIEAIIRIGKRDPARAKKLLEDLSQGGWAARTLHDELQASKKETPDKTKTPEPRRPPDANQLEFCKALERLTDCPPWYCRFTEFTLSDLPKTLFDRLAFPRAVVDLSDGKQVVVFDESAIAWAVSPDRAKREFIRNVAVAATVVDFVLVCCTTHCRDLEKFKSLLRADIRDRIAIHYGAVDIPSDEFLRKFARFPYY